VPNLKSIQSVKVKGLWEQYDVFLNLEPEVNILLGINGSGKSTLLKLIEGLLAWNIKRLLHYCDQMKITFDNGAQFTFGWISDESVEAPFISFKDDTNEWIKVDGQEHILLSGENATLLNTPLPSLYYSRISTFDNELKEKETINKLTNEKVNTELDWQIWQLEKKYLAYQLTISDRVEDLLNEDKPLNFKKLSQEVRKQKKLFEQYINQLFAQTGKIISSNKNKEIVFRHQTGRNVTPYELSSGEKQILVILLKVLLQDNQPHILLLDEPEISMHLSWQVDLIDLIRELNPNCQVIIATHAPAVIKKGWKDKILKMDDLLTECN